MRYYIANEKEELDLIIARIETALKLDAGLHYTYPVEGFSGWAMILREDGIELLTSDEKEKLTPILPEGFIEQLMELRK